MDKQHCRTCGQTLPTFHDVPGTIDEFLSDANTVPLGLRPLLMQAAAELRMWEQLGQQNGFKKHV
jgi:hypothetical protein